VDSIVVYMCIGIVNNGLELCTLEVSRALAFKLGAILGVGYILGLVLVFFLGQCVRHGWGFQMQDISIAKGKTFKG
jgi:hypothetical protein